MVIYVDIDETICFYSGGRDYYSDSVDYADATPNFENIDKINKLYEGGNNIIYWSARGATTSIDWTELTETQLIKWGCKYHELSVGQKPVYE